MAASCRLAAIGILVWLTIGAATAQSPPSQAIHLGVASCGGTNCHGAADRPPGSSVPGNEYIIWSKRDKHRHAYNALLQEQAVRMAHALGLPDAVNQKLCLDCHADNVPPAQRGRQFQLSDGIGCEACHGGAGNWLGVHISGASHHDNVAAGLYPIEQPLARAEKCLGCHFGDSTRSVDHRMYGAGHPRLGFELDTYTAIEPAHVVVDQSYIERKGKISDLAVWAVGQALALIKRMDAMLDSKRAKRSGLPDFALYDCQSCHHPFDPKHAPRPTASGLAPGSVRLDDANAVMLRAAATRLAPATARLLGSHTIVLQQILANEPHSAAPEAAAIRKAGQELLRLTANRDFNQSDLRAIADAVFAAGAAPDGWRFSHAEQTTMALEAVVAAMKSDGLIDGGREEAVSKAMGRLQASFTNDASVRPEAFAAALSDLQHAIGR